MKPGKHIVDTTLRDGEQSPDVSFSRDQKLKIAEILINCGVEQLEVGVPSGGEYERETIRQIIVRRGHAKIAVWSRLNTDDVRSCIDCEPDIVHISVPVSYVHIYSKLQKNKMWVINQLYTCVGLLQASGLKISVGFEDAFRSDASFLLSLAQTLNDLGITRVRLADTVGVATPTICGEMFALMRQYLGDGAELGFHAHNDFGMALPNTIAALKNGCDYADTTLLGIGERTGNCDFFNLIRTTSGLFDWGISAAGAQRAQEEYLEATRQNGGAV
ncbi:MAG: homocitrate synthase [Oscillospiraceae bacterium]|jgi:homocitrate synthase NifV|nr:homocitrate synthase [Oscillospiraceae bacterium]